jgi:dihydrofolate reductase
MISIIAAVSINDVIGKDNTLPWIVPEDLKHFKEKTTGHPIIMGWNTWRSIGEKPLPGRLNVILSRQNRPLPRSKDIKLIHNFMDINKFKNPFIIGGASLYNEYLPIADKLYITNIHKYIYGTGCVYFPKIDNSWEALSRTELLQSSTGVYYRFSEYGRI